jgi:hypothetical protein
MVNPSRIQTLMERNTTERLPTGGGIIPNTAAKATKKHADVTAEIAAIKPKKSVETVVAANPFRRARPTAASFRSVK